MNYKIGDRVRVLYPEWVGDGFPGEELHGTVRTILHDESSVGVELDDVIMGCHNLRHTLRENNGWYFLDEEIEDITIRESHGKSFLEFNFIK